MRINDITLSGALHRSTVVLPVTHAASAYAPATAASSAARPACRIATCVGVSGVEGTRVSTSAGTVGATAAWAVQGVQVKAAQVFVLKPVGGLGERQLSVRGAGEQPDQGDEQAQDLMRGREARVNGTTDITGSTNTGSTSSNNGTNPIDPWDLRTSSPPG